MRTNIVIDDKLMRETLRATAWKTKREAVDEALRTLLRLRKQAEIRRLRGKLDWQGDLNAMRSDSWFWSIPACGSITSREQSLRRATSIRPRYHCRAWLPLGCVVGKPEMWFLRATGR